MENILTTEILSKHMIKLYSILIYVTNYLTILTTLPELLTFYFVQLRSVFFYFHASFELYLKIVEVNWLIIILTITDEIFRK